MQQRYNDIFCHRRFICVYEPVNRALWKAYKLIKEFKCFLKYIGVHSRNYIIFQQQHDQMGRDLIIECISLIIVLKEGNIKLTAEAHRITWGMCHGWRNVQMKREYCFGMQSDICARRMSVDLRSRQLVELLLWRSPSGPTSGRSDGDNRQRSAQHLAWKGVDN